MADGSPSEFSRSSSELVVARWVADEGLCLDVSTGGELAVAERATFPGARIALHGNNKTAAEIEQALRYGVGRIVVDSLAEIERVDAVAARLGVVAPVMVRVTVGVEAHTHEFIATAHEDQKFGLSLATWATRSISAKESTTIRPTPYSSAWRSSGTDLLLPCNAIRSPGNPTRCATASSPPLHVSRPSPSYMIQRATAEHRKALPA